MKADEGDPRGLARKARNVQGSAPKRARSIGVWAIFFGVSPSSASSPG